MINCKYDLLTSEYDNGNYIVYKPDSLSNTSAFVIRSTKFDAKPDVKSSTRTMHTTLSLAKSGSAFNIRGAYDTINIPQNIIGSTFKLSKDVSYDSSINAEENVKKVLKMYSDEVKQWLFNFATTAPQGDIQFNSDYIRKGEGGCIFDGIYPLVSSYTLNYTRYTASNAYIIGTPKLSKGGFKLLTPHYLYNHYGITSPDTITSSMPTYDNEFYTMVKLLAAMISPKMQYPDESRGKDINLNMIQPISFALRTDGARMHYANFTSTSYPNEYINNIGVSLKTPYYNITSLFTPGCMFWNKGGVHISYNTSTTPATFSIAYCKYSEESSSLTNTATVVYGDSEISVNIAAIASDLTFDSDHYASLIPMYHYTIGEYNYFVVALFHNVKNISAADPTSYKGLFIVCMETGDIYNASTGFNNQKFNLSSSFDVTDLLHMYGWQQYDDASEIGSNAFQYTVSQDGVNRIYTFINKRIEICPYKAFGNYYLVCNPELYSTWYVYDLDSHNIYMNTNIPVSRNHCLTPDGMHGFRFEVNNKTDFLVKDYYAYPTLHAYDENVVNSIGIIRQVPIELFCSIKQRPSLFGYMIDGNHFIWNFAYNPKATFEPLDLNKSTAVFYINDSAPYNIGAMYFVVDITTDDNSLEFHHNRVMPEHNMFSPLNNVDIPYTFVDNTASTSLTPYNNIKVYVNEFINNDTYVNNSSDVIDVTLKQSSITSTNQSFRILLYDENNNIITQDELRKRYGVATIDIDFLMHP